jgi:hypothetical protein
LLQQLGDAEKLNATINAQYDQKVKDELIKIKIEKIDTEIKKNKNQ